LIPKKEGKKVMGIMVTHPKYAMKYKVEKKLDFLKR